MIVGTLSGEVTYVKVSLSRSDSFAVYSSAAASSALVSASACVLSAASFVPEQPAREAAVRQSAIPIAIHRFIIIVPPLNKM